MSRPTPGWMRSPCHSRELQVGSDRIMQPGGGFRIAAKLACQASGNLPDNWASASRAADLTLQTWISLIVSSVFPSDLYLPTPLVRCSRLGESNGRKKVCITFYI